MFPFTIRQVEAFLALCSSGSFSEAARHLGVSQPALSRLIRSLEQQLGFKLLERRPGYGARLLPAGEDFRDQALHFMRSGQLLGSARQSGTAPPLRAVRSYIGQHILSNYIQPNLPQLYARFPNYVLELVADRPRRQVVKDVAAGRIDFAVFATPEQVEMEGEIIGRDPGGLYAAPDFAADLPHGTDMSTVPFVLPPSGTLDERLILEALAEGGIKPTNIVARALFSEGRLFVAARGGCITYSTRSVQKAHPQFALVKIMPMPAWTRWLYISPDIPETLRDYLREIIIRSLKDT